MSSSSLNILRKYFYDPLNQLTGAGLNQPTDTQRFYQHGRVTTELEPGKQMTIFRQQALPLAQQDSAGGVASSALLMTDQAQSPLQALSGNGCAQLAFSAYGYHPAQSGSSQLVGFNGEVQDNVTRHYPLGRGNRFYNPVLMRFNSPDAFSPFDEGWINAYAYCGGDPVNFSDPSGNVRSGIVLGTYVPVPVSPPPARKSSPARTPTPVYESSPSMFQHWNIPIHREDLNKSTQTDPVRFASPPPGSPRPGPSGTQQVAPISIKQERQPDLRELLRQPVSFLPVPDRRDMFRTTRGEFHVRRAESQMSTNSALVPRAAPGSFNVTTSTNTGLASGGTGPLPQPLQAPQAQWIQLEIRGQPQARGLLIRTPRHPDRNNSG